MCGGNDAGMPQVRVFKRPVAGLQNDKEGRPSQTLVQNLWQMVQQQPMVANTKREKQRGQGVSLGRRPTL